MATQKPITELTPTELFVVANGVGCHEPLSPETLALTTHDLHKHLMAAVGGCDAHHAQVLAFMLMQITGVMSGEVGR